MGKIKMKNKILISIILFVISIIIINYSSALLTDNLKAYYNMSESSGTNVVSATGQFNGTASGTTIVTGKIGNARNWTTTELIDLGTSICQLETTDYTFSVWVYNYGTFNSGYNTYIGNQLGSGNYRGTWAGAYNNKPIFESVTDGSNYDNVKFSNLSINNNTWYNIVTVRRNVTISIYVNGQLSNSSTGTSGGTAIRNVSNGINCYIGKNGNRAEYWKGTIDEVGIWNRSLTSTEITQLYNNGNGLTYPFIIANFTPTYTINLSNSLNINSSVLFNNYTLIVTNYTNTNLTNDTATIYYTSKTTLNNNCSIFYQTVCIDNGTYKSKLMTKINVTTFITNFSDTDIFPAYYPYNYTYIDNSLHYNYTAYSNNNILFHVFNMSNQTTYNLLLELDLKNKTNVTSALLIYYCNSSYTDGNPSLRPLACELIDSYSSNTYIHTHNQSKHTVVPVVVQNITKTQHSMFVFVASSNQLNGWVFEYVNDTRYDNSSFENGNFNAWGTNPTKTNMIFDMHIHPFNSNDYFSTYAILNDSNNLTTSDVINDLFELDSFPPSTSMLLNPVCNMQFTLNNTNTTIIFNWTKGTSINNLSIKYTLFINNLIDYYLAYNLTTNNYTYNLNTNSLPAGNYYTYIQTCDSMNNCDYSISDCSFNICKNTWTQNLNPCVSNSQLITYYDSSNCNAQYTYNLPSNNGSYISCVTPPTIIQNTYSTDIILLFILGFFLIVGLICGIFVHELFFLFCALITLLFAIISIQYNYPNIILFACAFLIMTFIGITFLVHKMKK